MIRKDLIFPLRIEQLQAMERRLPCSHTHLPAVKEKLAIELAGYKGENALRHPLSFLPDQFSIYYDLRLFDGTHYFQNDALILTSRWILLIEAKYFAGELFYENNQVRREWNDEVQGFNDPLIQVKRHKRQLEKWLINQNLPHLPIHCLVANSHPHCVIHSDHPEVIRTYNLPENIEIIERLHEERTHQDIHELSQALLDHHQSFSYDYAAHFQIGERDVMTGVHCQDCGTLGMTRLYGGWYCGKCKNKSKNAHIHSLRDYALLLGKKITNAQARRYLQLSSPSTTKRILQSSVSRRVGMRKSSVYELDLDSLVDKN
ncbi:nuclease-related domain-containing protein [Halobacillus yeomjeoni]|uniref:NERD domain-containing protein n=1 Tax=Halobacillus yeomjeoni TaxID=311194 RepID=A0A931HX60_9BACI|nr:nuclease-related domain-containing protein [Halobacillus yeomjeoni]MBH0230846.1 NERD domain-containing protein [Halobacillus yeomjeoni]